MRDREGTYCTACLVKFKERDGRFLAERKRIVYEHYGNACICCGETEPAFLSIDHINGHEWKSKDRPRKARSGSFYQTIIREGFPDDLRILCMNCNWGRRSTPDGRCPHEIARDG